MKNAHVGKKKESGLPAELHIKLSESYKNNQFLFLHLVFHHDFALLANNNFNLEEL